MKIRETGRSAASCRSILALVGVGPSRMNVSIRGARILSLELGIGSDLIISTRDLLNFFERMRLRETMEQLLRRTLTL